MTGWTLAVVLLAVGLLPLGVVQLTLGREVRRLRDDVNALSQERHGRGSEPGGPALAGPALADAALRHAALGDGALGDGAPGDAALAGAARADAASTAARSSHLRVDRSRSVAGPTEDVLKPTPLGPDDGEPDPTVARVASVTLSGPLIKVAAFSSGVRRALDEETRMRVAYAFRKELRRQRRVRRQRTAARAAGPLRDGGWHP
jgi:hypothetical protein